MKIITGLLAHLRNWSKRLSLSSRITLGVVLLITVSTVLAIVLISNLDRRHYIEENSTRIALGAEIKKQQLLQMIDNLRQDVGFLSRVPPIQGIIQAVGNRDIDVRENRSLDDWTGLLQQAFSSFVTTHPDNFQIRLIGIADRGRELVRVELEHGQVRVVPPDQLQQKDERDYFQATLALQAGEIYLSKINLNREQGKIQEPRVRTLRAATPVFGPDGKAFGMLVINMNAGPFLDQLAANTLPGTLIYLMNEQGDYLVHPDTGKTFGFDLGQRHRWQEEFPDVPIAITAGAASIQDRWSRMVSSPAGPLQIELSRIDFDPQQPARYLTLAYAMPDALVSAHVSKARNSVIGTLLTMALLLGGLFFLYLRRTLAPLQQLTLAASEIGAGRYHSSLTATGSDEIGTLITAFQGMQEQIGARDREIKQVNNQLARSEAYANRIIDTAPEAILVVDTQGRIIRVNSRAEQLFGYPEEAMLHQPVEMLVPQQFRAQHAALRQGYVREAPQRLMGSDREVLGQHRDGHEIPLEIGLAPFEEEDTHYVIASISDISRRKASEELKQRDREQQATLRALLETTLTGATLEETLAECLRQLLAVSWLSLLPKGGIFVMSANGQGLRLTVSHNLAPELQSLCAHVPLGQCVCGRAAASRQMQYTDCVDEHHDTRYPGMADHGHYSLPLLLSGEPLGVLVLYLPPGFQREPQKEEFLASVADILAGYISRKQHEKQLCRAAAVLESTHEGVMVTDLDSHIILINPAFTEITGYTEQEALGKNPSLLKSDRHDKMFYQQIWAALRENGFWQGEIWNRRKNGEIYPQWSTISSVLGESDEITNYVGVFTDISQIKNAEDQLSHLAHHDALTDLPNRLLMQTLLKHALDRARREGHVLALLFLDLDRFKNINDSLGHAAGDELLQIAANRLSERMRDSDTVARLGGDEFVLLLEELNNPDDAANVAQDIIELFKAPFRLTGGQEVYIGVSIGISIFPNDGDSAAQLIRNADSAMYQAKDAGRNTYRFYTEALTQHAEQRLHLEGRLRRALEKGEMLLHYQPLTGDGRCKGVEALVRWQDPEEGMVSPMRFIPLAEETLLIVPLGEWILRTACSQMKSWLDAGLALQTMAVNLSPVQFQQPDFPQQLQAILTETGLSAAHLELEITEGTIMQQGQEAEAKLAALHDLGVRLAIDDFGTGYSSLAYLKRFPIHKLKIDQSFVRDILESTASMEITATIIAMARNLKLEVLAEGVETAAQLACLQDQNCGSFQGYLFSRPVAAEAIPEAVQRISQEYGPSA